MKIEQFNLAEKLKHEIDDKVRQLSQWEKYNSDDHLIMIGEFSEPVQDYYWSVQEGPSKTDFDILKASVVARLQREIYDLKEQFEYV